MSNLRMKKYREQGGAKDFVKVEVLVPHSARKEILDQAQNLRANYRSMQNKINPTEKSWIETKGKF